MAWRERAKEIQTFLDQGLSYGDIAKHYGVARHTLRGKLKQLRDDGLIHYENRDTHYDENQAKENAKRAAVAEGKIPPDAQKEIDKHGQQKKINWKSGEHYSERLVWMSTAQDKDEAFLLTAHGYDPKVWEITSSTSKSWNGYSKVDGIFTLFSSSISVKKREYKYTDDDMMAFFERLASTYQSPVYVPTRYSKEGKLLELNIADLHVGKLAWAGDSGDIYNHEIARERFFYIINDILTKTQSYKFERILFVWCNDFMHVDSPAKTTTGGTPQDASMQYEHMFEYAAEMLIQGMDLVNQVAPVTTMYTASNHDRLTSFFATKYLQAWFRNNPDVIVDSRPLARKAIRYGQNLIGFTHGHLEKKNMGAWLAKDYKKDWGETRYHEVHAAHVHSEKSIWEENGQITRFISSPTGADRWHNDSTFTGAIQKGQSFIWDRENGLEDTKNTVIHIGVPEREAIVI